MVFCVPPPPTSSPLSASEKCYSGGEQTTSCDLCCNGRTICKDDKAAEGVVWFLNGGTSGRKPSPSSMVVAAPVFTAKE